MSQMSRIVTGAIVGLGLVMIAILGFQLDGPIVVNIGKYSQLAGALIGGLLALTFAGLPLRRDDGTEPWVGFERLGWILVGLGLGVYLRRFLPITSQELVERRVRRTQRVTFGAAEFVPYVLLAILSVVLVLNVLSTDPGQRAIRPVLVFASIDVVRLVIVRQILTILDNGRLTRYQTDALERLELADRRIEDQARMIAERNAELEKGTHTENITTVAAMAYRPNRACNGSTATFQVGAAFNRTIQSRYKKAWLTL